MRSNLYPVIVILAAAAMAASGRGLRAEEGQTPPAPAEAAAVAQQGLAQEEADATVVEDGSVDEEARPGGEDRAPAAINYRDVPQDHEEEEEAGAAALTPAQQAAAAASEAAKNAFELEVLGFRDYRTVAALRKKVESVIERSSPVMKRRASWGSALYQFRTAIEAKEIQNALMSAELGETVRLKSVGFAKNRFTVEVQ
ncbi:MAG: hypothetical protein IT285_04170 [Bdellovibrionales bacterium]|nr:hypothetical protein [Bdellovibrionales bacterium]